MTVRLRFYTGCKVINNYEIVVRVGDSVVVVRVLIWLSKDRPEGRR